ncbi:SGNH/GDSL hydrolase family protein [Daejeonella sp. H1SJ63]|jgi:hypothetical protein|uniref:SGNH/GDSL hydrolase family protein n=1 Tax=Daejeonella sp. H1SJ63 TaxID=3034145 RepID=UPI0023EBE0B5|nr:SGNH/GDSL hydrolase family protein [Daejeonella sp. H1SJ63]
MRKVLYLLILTVFSSSVFSQETAVKKENVKYFDKEHFIIEGTGVAESAKESPYDRLPASSKDKVRKAVWDLSKNSAGITVRFFSNSSLIKIKWELLNDTKMNHMAETGIKGVDLYTRVNGSWLYVNTGRPTAKNNEALLVSTLSPEKREYKVWLPLYDGVTKVEIGIDTLASIEKPAPSRTLPIVFYGTSITQGGCASRPAMAYTTIISRKMDVDCINLGFSGNGKMEDPVVDVIAGINASFYVIDCLPNMTVEEVRQRVAPLATKIREKNSNTPIVFVENIVYSKSFYEEKTKSLINDKNNALKTEFEKLRKSGMKNLHYINNNGAIGYDNEATVDGVHMTDLGFMRMADYLIENFDKNYLKIK